MYEKGDIEAKTGILDGHWLVHETCPIRSPFL